MQPAAEATATQNIPGSSQAIKLLPMGLLSKIGPIGRLLAFWKILRDKSVPWWGKISFIAASLGYVVSPVDLIPDIFLGIGWLDDLIILPVFAWLFGKVLPGIVRRWGRRQKAQGEY